jgi:hypothetical protein
VAFVQTGWRHGDHGYVAGIMPGKNPANSSSDPALKPLERLIGTWTTEATHPALPGLVVHGTAVIEWLEGKRFLILRARTDHPDFPDSISIIGFTGRDRVDPASESSPAADSNRPLDVHYFDSRGVFRQLNAAVDDVAWRIWRDAPGFSQRFAGTFSDGGATIAGLWELRRDDVNWNDDLRITYRRSS